MAQPKMSRYISFRVTEAQLEKIESRAADAGVKTRDWCRSVVLETIGCERPMTRMERFLFEQFVCSQYLVTHGFLLLADDNLTSEEWKRVRAIANERTSEIADMALTMRTKTSGQRRR